MIEKKFFPTIEVYGETVILLWLLIWIITEKQVFLTEQFLKKKQEEQEKNSIFMLGTMPNRMFSNQRDSMHVMESIC